MAVHLKPELAHEHKCLLRGDDLHLRIAKQDLLDGGPVVGLHMIDDQVIQPSPAQEVLHILQELAAGRPVHRVEENGLLVQQQVGVVGHPSGDGMDILKEGQPVIVSPHPVEVLGDVSHAIHLKIPLSVILQ